MRGPNLSEWALKHQTLVLFFMLLIAAAGVMSYFELGRAEDPAFTFRGMVINVIWPGATAREMEQQVTDRIEKKLQETPGLEHVRSFSKPGEAFIFVFLRDNVDPATVPNSWYQVRKKLADIKHTLPSDVIGPFFNDEFGDTFGNIYALTADGFSQADLRVYAEKARQELLRVPDVAKVELLGVQPEKVYIELSDAKLATLGLDPGLIISTLQSQNVMTSAGDVVTDANRVYLRVTGNFESVENIREIGIRANNRIFRLGDIARIHRGYADPPGVRMRFKGEDAVGVAVSMQPGGDILKLGERLDAAWLRVQAGLPIGVDVHRVSDQPAVVKTSVNEFMRTLAEAVAIVLIVSFFSLGLRTGLVVALSIPLVLLAVFLFMRIAGIDLQKISLGALIIALGLLVDDAIIAVEMMKLKLEQGWDRVRAATFAYTSTAFPMLTGTLITAAGFLPVGLAKSAAGEYTFGIFAVVGIALMVSWVVAVVFTPYIGYKLLPENLADSHHGHEVYDTPFYTRFRALVGWCVQHRRIVITATIVAFVMAVLGFKFVQQQFFPDSTRPEIIVDLWLPEGSSHVATDAQARKLEAILKTDPRVENYVAYLGGGSSRFVLVLDQQMPNTNLVEFVVLAKSLKDRESLINDLREKFVSDFPGVRARAARLPNGPPVGYPVQFRVMGYDPDKVCEYATEVADIMRANPNTLDVNYDWYEKTKVVRLEVDQDKARTLGVSTQQLSQNLRTLLTGLPITQYRENDQLIDIVARTTDVERGNLSRLKDINIHVGQGRFVPLSQVARIRYEAEDGLIWRRDRLPTITVRSDIPDHVQAPDVTMQIDPLLQAIRDKMPPGYRIEIGGSLGESVKSQASINAGMPMMIAVIVTLLMLQLQSFSRMTLTLLTAPLGLIGVTVFLLLFRQPFGFVAMLGVIALAGMIMRNSVILVDQIEQDIAEGITPWEAIIGSAVRRFRPIMLTALAAILAMIPLARSVFWGPMAVAIMGGLLVATVLTLLVLPAMYAAWFKVRRPAH
ncbi:efflux RND transporter permease subunit [Permianibacter sp. IMCC34836]|nr:efflux RND transporter permease subunit [Permianibacter fluminis]